MKYANDHLDIVYYHISIGANKESKNFDELTPLICASLNNYLLPAGANKKAKDKDGNTPLFLHHQMYILELFNTSSI